MALLLCWSDFDSGSDVMEWFSQATDEQILSMLNDHEQDPKQVIRHILEREFAPG